MSMTARSTEFASGEVLADEMIALFTDLRDVLDDPVRAAHLRERLVQHYLPMAERVARHFRGRGEDHQDLVQVARMGLLKAVDRFDPAIGTNFVSFALPTMMGEIRRHFRDHSWAMHVPRRLKDRHGALSIAFTDLTATLGRAPTPSELAAALDLSREDVVDGLLAAQAYRPLSYDAPAAPTGGSVPWTLGDTVGTVDAAFDRIDDQRQVRPLIAALPDRERTIIYLRFFESLTQSQIGERVGLSQMHVSRILDKTLRKLREQL